MESSDLSNALEKLYSVLPISWEYYRANEEDTEYDFAIISFLGRERSFQYDVIEQVFLQDEYTEIGISNDKLFLSIVPLKERNIWVD